MYTKIVAGACAQAFGSSFDQRRQTYPADKEPLRI